MIQNPNNQYRKTDHCKHKFRFKISENMEIQEYIGRQRNMEQVIQIITHEF